MLDSLFVAGGEVGSGHEFGIVCEEGDPVISACHCELMSHFENLFHIYKLNADGYVTLSRFNPDADPQFRPVCLAWLSKRQVIDLKRSLRKMANGQSTVKETKQLVPEHVG